MTGLRYGRLVGIGFSHRDRSGHAHWLFLCDCGGEVVSGGSSVRAGNALSCGCLHREISAARLTTHGRRAAKRYDPTYRAWQAMNDACANPASPRYDRIGALGIGVAEAWRESFAAFLEDMGERPENTVLDRNATDTDFGSGNCRWAPVRSRSRRAREGWNPRTLHRMSAEASTGLEATP